MMNNPVERLFAGKKRVEKKLQDFGASVRANHESKKNTTYGKRVPLKQGLQTLRTELPKAFKARKKI